MTFLHLLRDRLSAAARAVNGWRWRSVVGVAGLLLGVLATAPAALTAQADSLPMAEMSTPADGVDSSSGAQASESSDPLPAPSYTRAYWHLFIAFGIAWALLFGYVVILDRRIGQARRELERMGGE